MDISTCVGRRTDLALQWSRRCPVLVIGRFLFSLCAP